MQATKAVLLALAFFLVFVAWSLAYLFEAILDEAMVRLVSLMD